MASLNQDDDHFDAGDHFIFDPIRFYLSNEYNDNITIYICLQQVLLLLY